MILCHFVPLWGAYGRGKIDRRGEGALFFKKGKGLIPLPPFFVPEGVASRWEVECGKYSRVGEGSRQKQKVEEASAEAIKPTLFYFLHLLNFWLLSAVRERSLLSPHSHIHLMSIATTAMH